MKKHPDLYHVWGPGPSLCRECFEDFRDDDCEYVSSLYYFHYVIIA
jgi:hypothetical protein